MNKKLLVTIVVVVLVGVGWFLFQNNYANGPTMGDDTENVDGANADDNADVTNDVPADDGTGGTDGTTDTTTPVITYTDSGFSPAELVVDAGTAVTFLNSSSRDFWPASAVHPTHKSYPGSGIEKCGTDEEDTIFDACGAVHPGESYVFTFDEVGSWNYHDHLNASKFGKVVVQ